jgi:tetratricopeptide (TPR) repeat protein
MTNIIGQSAPENHEDFDEGQFFFNRDEYQDALFFYLKLIEHDSMNANFNFKIGECYLNLPGKEYLAVPFFEKSIFNLVPKKKYNKKDINERNAPLHALFYLGNAYRMDNQLNKALDCYAKFMDSPYFWGNYNQDVVEQEIKSCERAKVIQDAPIDLEKINLGPAINSTFSEEMPVVSGDGNTLVFLRHLKFYNAVFYSVKVNNAWREAVNINPEILSDGDFYATGLSFDGSKLLLIKKDSDNSEIYISYLKNDVWSKAALLENKINSSHNVTFGSFGPNEKSIYLSGNRSGGRGDFDIYVSKITSNGSWGRPKALGKPINTKFDEQNPILCSKGEVLFFTSKGQFSMGGYDIFYSYLSEGKWSLPVNIGYPINDTRDNMLFYPTEQCRKGYMAINDSTGYGESDIYLVTIKSKSVLNLEKINGDK